MNRWIGEKDDSRRARCSTQDFALKISQDVFSFQSLRTPTIHGCQASIDVRVNGYNCFGLNCKQRVECRVTPTDRACWSPSLQLRILGQIATKYFSMQDTLTPWPSEWRNLCIFNCIARQDLARPLHLLQVLALPPDDITRRLKKPALYLWTTITIRVKMTPLITQESHSDYQHTSILTHSDTAVLVKIPSGSENVSIIENNHVSPLQKRASIVFGSDRKWEARIN